MKYYAITTTIITITITITTDDKGNKALAGEYAKKPKLTTTGNHKLYWCKINNEYSVKVERLDGRLIVQKMPVPGMECFAICLDTERTTALSYGKQIAQLNKRNILIK